jgi:hypothetical protein
MLALTGCDRDTEVVADSTRPLTMRDRNLTLDADNGERFRRGRPQNSTPRAPAAPVKARFVPDGWQEQQPSQFRLINYTFGTAGQAYVSTSRGGIVENVNRWLRQFGAEPLDAGAVAQLERAEAAGYEGVRVAAAGRFGGGMGQEPQDGWALRGLVAEKDGAILTVKMLGPEDEVLAQEENLRRFIDQLVAVP